MYIAHVVTCTCKCLHVHVDMFTLNLGTGGSCNMDNIVVKTDIWNNMAVILCLTATR